MTLPEMNGFALLREANAARQKEWDRGDVITLEYRANELAGETGEACNIVKKLARERLGIRGSRATVGQLADELADVIICADLVAMQAGVDLGRAVARKFNETSEKNGLSVFMRRRESTDFIDRAAPQPQDPAGSAPVNPQPQAEGGDRSAPTTSPQVAEVQGATATPGTAASALATAVPARPHPQVVCAESSTPHAFGDRCIGAEPAEQSNHPEEARIYRRCEDCADVLANPEENKCRECSASSDAACADVACTEMPTKCLKRECGGALEVDGRGFHVCVLCDVSYGRATAAEPVDDRKWHADGWPLCPKCVEDELFSLADPATAAAIEGCYRCNWRPRPFANLERSAPEPVSAPPAALVCTRCARVLCCTAKKRAAAAVAQTFDACQMIGGQCHGGQECEMAALRADLAAARAEVERLKGEVAANRYANELRNDAMKAAAHIEDILNMYAKAWAREIGGPYRNKHYEIDALVLTTQMRIKERDEARADGARLTRERDEARAEAARLLEAARLAVAVAYLRPCISCDKPTWWRERPTGLPRCLSCINPARADMVNVCPPKLREYLPPHDDDEKRAPAPTGGKA